MKLLIVSVFIFLAPNILFAKKAKPVIVYKYKKFQKFDFEEINIGGGSGGPGDLSITPRFQRKFKNKLPYRRNFKPEIAQGLERIQ